MAINREYQRDDQCNQCLQIVFPGFHLRSYTILYCISCLIVLITMSMYASTLNGADPNSVWACVVYNF